MKKPLFTSIVLIVIFLSLVKNSNARTEPSLEQSIIRNIANFAAANQGRFATNWNQLTNFMDFDRINNEILANTSATPIQSNYVFIPFDLPMSGGEDCKVLLARVSPLTNDDIAGRYIIFSCPGGSTLSRWIREDEFQKMLAAAGVSEVPKPQEWNLIQSPENNQQTNSAPPSESISTPPVTPPNMNSSQTSAPVTVGSEPPTNREANEESATNSPVKWSLIILLATAGAFFAYFLLRKK